MKLEFCPFFKDYIVKELHLITFMLIALVCVGEILGISSFLFPTE